MIGHNSKAAITAELEELRPVKTRKVLQIVCEVPMESADAVLEALGGFPIPGQSRPVAIALLNPKEIALNHTDAATAEQTPEEPERLKGGARAKRAGILCNDPAFQYWLSKRWGGHWKVYSCHGEMTHSDIAANVVRRLCGVQESRAELDHNETAGLVWDQIDADYRASEQGRTDPEVARQRAAGPS